MRVVVECDELVLGWLEAEDTNDAHAIFINLFPASKGLLAVFPWDMVTQSCQYFAAKHGEIKWKEEDPFASLPEGIRKAFEKEVEQSHV